jgi:hypothetical protein
MAKVEEYVPGGSGMPACASERYQRWDDTVQQREKNCIPNTQNQRQTIMWLSEWYSIQ